MSSNKIIKDYVSEIDKFLQTFDRQHPEKSLSQQKEIAKHKRIQQLRDHAEQPIEVTIKLWEEF